MKNKKMKPNALVKQRELDCYDWVHEEGLFIVAKLDNLDKENQIYLFQAYNIDKKEWGSVASHQIIILDEKILKLPPIMENYDIISGSGNEVIGIKLDKDKNTKDIKD